MRDYAKKSYRPVQNNNNSSGQWLLILLLFGAIGFVSTLAYHFTHETITIKKEEQIAPIPPQVKPIDKPKSKIKNKPAKIAKKIPVKKEKVIALNPADEQPKYDFYQLLPKMTVTIPTQAQSSKPIEIPSITPN
ncbi:MAG: hypothetical protein A3E82_03075 [Gammaproteobacteria bacterium RIFCSPHIGHO2_12_FULL_38_11]|nr:MAG: hypothetical protein A3E82_03075 [Gammaproteobacteria bacterium RIFCSPHIGHO2_12_FULL_38_11]